MMYQVRIKTAMSDAPASELLETYAEAAKRLEEVKQEIKNERAMPEMATAYIFENRLKKKGA